MLKNLNWSWPTSILIWCDFDVYLNTRMWIKIHIINVFTFTAVLSWSHPSEKTSIPWRCACQPVSVTVGGRKGFFWINRSQIHSSRVIAGRCGRSGESDNTLFHTQSGKPCCSSRFGFDTPPRHKPRPGYDLYIYNGHDNIHATCL